MEKELIWLAKQSHMNAQLSISESREQMGNTVFTNYCTREELFHVNLSDLVEIRLLYF
jgi:hypothetical protein